MLRASICKLSEDFDYEKLGEVIWDRNEIRVNRDNPELRCPIPRPTSEDAANVFIWCSCKGLKDRGMRISSERPNTSSSVYPNIRSAAGLNKVIKPFESTVTIASLANSKIPTRED